MSRNLFSAKELAAYTSYIYKLHFHKFAALSYRVPDVKAKTYHNSGDGDSKEEQRFHFLKAIYIL
jgi:hypothetical protein